MSKAEPPPDKAPVKTSPEAADTSTAGSSAVPAASTESEQKPQEILDEIGPSADALLGQVEPGGMERSEQEQRVLFAEERHKLNLALGHQNRKYRDILIAATLLVIAVFYFVFLCFLVPLLQGHPPVTGNWHWLVPLGLTGAIATTLLLVLLKGVFYGANGDAKAEADGPELMPPSLKLLAELLSVFFRSRG